MLYANQDWLPSGTSNHGELISPARPLPEFELQRFGGGVYRLDDLRGKWTLVYIGPSNCEQVCQDSLYKTRQVRLTQGKHVDRIQRLFVVSDDARVEALRPVVAEHPDLDVVLGSTQILKPLLAEFDTGDGVVPRDAQRVYIVDPLGNLMMLYEPGFAPKGLQKDLHRLLKVSQIG